MNPVFILGNHFALLCVLSKYLRYLAHRLGTLGMLSTSVPASVALIAAASAAAVSGFKAARTASTSIYIDTLLVGQDRRKDHRCIQLMVPPHDDLKLYARPICFGTQGKGIISVSNTSTNEVNLNCKLIVDDGILTLFVNSKCNPQYKNAWCWSNIA